MTSHRSSGRLQRTRQAYNFGRDTGCVEIRGLRQAASTGYQTLTVKSAKNDAQGQIRFANGAVESLFGYAGDELLQLKIEALLPRCFRKWDAEFRSELPDRNAPKAEARSNLWGRRKDGVEIPLKLEGNRVESSEGDLILVTIIDIAERVQQERGLALAKEAADVDKQADSDFLARLSHEIRTPMGLIMG